MPGNQPDFGSFLGLAAIQGEIYGLHGRTVGFHDNLDFDLRFAKV
jgi:hypothetical protein